MIFARSIGPIPVDIVVKETLESTLKITREPVEFGADITDHAYVEPKRIVIEGVIGGSLSRSSSGRMEAMAGWQALKRLQESRMPFTLVSGLDVHRNILIEKLTADRDKDWSRVLKFTAECSEIIIVSSATVSGGLSNAPANGQARGLNGNNTQAGTTANRAAPDVARGDAAIRGVSTDPSTATGGRGASLLHRMTN